MALQEVFAKFEFEIARRESGNATLDCGSLAVQWTKFVYLIGE